MRTGSQRPTVGQEGQRRIQEVPYKPCGWIKVNNYTLDDAPDTICDYNITVDWNDVNPIEINKIAPLIIASFDIECSSSHGDFPVAIKNYKKLAQDLCYLTKAGLLDDKKIADLKAVLDKLKSY